MTTGIDIQNSGILVVDDDEAVRKLIHLTLRRQGYRCTAAANSQEARQLLDVEPFALLLSDIHMPGESGLDLVAHVKSSYEDMAVIIVTVIDDIETAQRALSLDIYGYMVKPIDKNQIVIGVTNALRRRQLELKQKNQSRELEEKINRRTRELSETVEKLKVRESELAAKMEELHELNTALKVLLNNRETDRLTLEENIQSNVRKFILPSIERLKKGTIKSKQIQSEFGLLEASLNDLVAPFARQISSDYFGLTPNEIKVALLIKQGMTTKEIAKELNLSVNTIMTHRYKIRSKLGIKNQTKNLQVYLKQFPRQ
ncbi:MAG: response regulator [Desulfobacteraceae bacterium]|jgi:DNA-binding NarL/FixJ family response regulator